MELNLKIIRPDKPEDLATAKIYMDGKIGFSKGTVKKFHLTSLHYFHFAANTIENDNNLYLIKAFEDDDGAIKLTCTKEGYGYLNTSQVVKKAISDYSVTEYIYDVEEGQYEERKMLILKFKEKKPRTRGKNKPDKKENIPEPTTSNDENIGGMPIEHNT